MGWHNRITLEQFGRIKEALREYDMNVPATSVVAEDRTVAKWCGVGRTTVTHVRLARDYEDYCRRTKGKYWYATEQPKEKPNLPQVKITKRDVKDGVQGVKEATTVRDGDITIRIIIEHNGKEQE